MLPKSMVGTFELTISVMVPHPGNVLAETLVLATDWCLEKFGSFSYSFGLKNSKILFRPENLLNPLESLNYLANISGHICVSF